MCIYRKSSTEVNVAEATSATNAKKLDEILRRLTGQPTIDEWHDLATMLTEVSNTVTRIGKKVDKLDAVVITGNGEPPLRQRMHDIELAMGAITKVTWIVVGVLVSAVTYGAIKLFNMP